MLPGAQEKYLRICNACNQLMELTRNALINGDLATVQVCRLDDNDYANSLTFVSLQNTALTGRVVFTQPYSIFPDGYFPVHCATLSGNLELLRWLVEEKSCSIQEKDSKSDTPLAVAARMNNLYLLEYLVHKGANTTEISGLESLQILTQALLEASAEKTYGSASSGWACDACTYVNGKEAAHCGVCTTPRTAAPIRQSAPDAAAAGARATPDAPLLKECKASAPSAAAVAAAAATEDDRWVVVDAMMLLLRMSLCCCCVHIEVLEPLSSH